MESAPPAPRPRALPALVRILIGAAVLAFVVLRDPGRLFAAIGRADVGAVLGAAAAMFAGIFVSALRWRAYLQALEIPMRMGSLFRLYFVGTFFNAFLPTGVGGDAYKAVRVGRSRGDRALAFASVILDRFAGLVALALIGLSGVVVELAQRDPDLRVAGVSLALSAGVLLAALVLLTYGERLLGGGRVVGKQGWGEAVRRAVRGIHVAGRHPGAALRSHALGVVYQLLVLLEHVLLARALGISTVSIAAMAGIMVVAQVATLIPVTVNGLGFREAAYVWALGTFGVAGADAQAFAVLVLAILLATSIAGGIVYVAAGGHVRD